MISLPRLHTALPVQAAMICLTALLTAQAPVLAADMGYHVAAKQALPGQARWDYLTYEPLHNRLFISHADHVDVYDVAKKAIIGAIPDTQGVHGIALAPGLDRGYTSNGKANTVTVFRLSDLAVLANVATARKPDAIVFDPATGYVFTANGGGNSLSIIDTAHNSNIGTIALGGKPEFAVVDGKGLLFVNLEDKNQLLTIDTRKQIVTQRYNLAPACSEPTGLALDRVRQRAFVGCQNRSLQVVNVATGELLQSLPIDAHNDAVVYDDKTRTIFSSNGAGTLTVIGATGANRYAVQQVVPTLPGARTMALDTASGSIYLVSAENRPLDTSGQNAREVGTFVLITVAP